jgi:fibronectin-binding autotransporter adhesin
MDTTMTLHDTHHRTGISQSCRKDFCFALPLAIALALGVLLPSPTAQAADRNWQASAGDWLTASNWAGGIPGSADSAYIQNGGTANITAGAENAFSLSLGSGTKAGTVQMTGGSLTIPSITFAQYGGSGTFVQSGGTVAMLGVNALLQMTNNTNVISEKYVLSGNGRLSSYVENLDGVPASFQQSGGLNTTTVLSIKSAAAYKLSGGTLQVNDGGLSGNGTFDGGNGRATLSAANCIVDFSQFSLINAGSMSVSMGANSLLIVPTGFDTSKNFASYGSAGLTHTAGTTLTVPAGRTIDGWGMIYDQVDCQGTLVANTNIQVPYAGISLQNGLILSGTGAINLYNGRLLVNDTTSRMSGGSLAAMAVLLAGNATTSFAHSGGTLQTNAVYVDDNYGNSSTYNLSGSGVLSAGSEYVADVGPGSSSFIHSGGTNSVASLYIGNSAYQFPSSGSYALSNSGVLSVTGTAFVGYGMCGSLSQSGGISTFNTLAFNASAGGSGTCSLNGGLMVASNITSGTGATAFNFSGGTLRAGATFSTSLPMTLGTSDSAVATFDSAGKTMTLSGALAGAGSLAKVGSGVLVLGAANTFNGKTSISGGTLALASALALQNGTLDTSGSGSLAFGSLTAATLGALTGSGTLTLSNSASVAVGLSVGKNNAATTFTGVLKGTGSLTKIGSGALLFSGSEVYMGATTVSQGKLIVNGWLINSAVTVNSGGTLGGFGSLLKSATINAGGHLAPGNLTAALGPSGSLPANETIDAGGYLAPVNSPGTLSLSGSLVLAAGAVMDYDLDAPADSDELLMATSQLKLTEQQFADFHFTPQANFGAGTYTLIDAGSISGSLGASTSGMINGRSASLAIQGNDVVLNVVPEPSTLALLGSGALGLMCFVARRRRRVWQ